jgi:hypothetical protein
MYKKIMFICTALIAVFEFFQTCSFAADEEPPKNRLVISKRFENIVDNSWSNLEFPENEQPPGLYYIELTELEGSVGCWGSRNNPYEDGPNGELLIAWEDGEPMEGNKDSDFRLQYRPTQNTEWVELIVIAPQGAIGDAWNPFALQDASESIGQTFIAPEKFTGVGLQTPTWVTNNSGCTISLYAERCENVELAFGPDPKDGALHEDTWVTLSWRAGDFAVSHDVYLGDNFDDVNEATQDSDLFWGNQDLEYIIVGFAGYPYPDGLVPGTTYYWRIDEVNDAEPNSPWKGNVWSFSLPPQTAYFPDPSDGAELVGLDTKLSWTAGFGAKLHYIIFGEDFDEISNATMGRPNGTTTYNPGPLKLAKTYYWRIDESDGFGTYKGEVWSFTTIGAASNPNPANGIVDVSSTQVLTWNSGAVATSHEVYFGMDADAVKNATKSSPEYKGPKALREESYDPGKLEFNSAYYWRVDEVNDASTDSPWAGKVWSFTTGDFFVIDDFEDYDTGENQIWYAWHDGLGYGAPGTDPYYAGNSTGAAVGDETTTSYTEETIVHGGIKSMPVSYDNNKQGYAYYSEVEHMMTDQRDWTERGVGELSIWFRGISDNGAEPLYVAVSNSTGAPAVIVHDDANAAQIDIWTEWIIPLSAFADQGINMTNVDKIAIGIGTQGNTTTTGGSGKMYIDDIRLYQPREVAE